MVVAYLTLFLVGHVASRIYVLGLLDGIVHPNPILSLLSTMALPATLTLAVWGATSVPWY
ncbi:MAG: hypothetical protein Q8J78_01455 [Moraxellaceae bacterium]|nr:hypothetical protein [Moraxellaceae bacterium]